MRRHLQIVCAGLLVGALVLAVACGGGGGEGEKQTSIKPAEADLLVSNPSGALGASAGKFEDEVDSVEGEFTLEMKIGDVSVGAAGTFAYKAPDSVHMTMNMSGASEELQGLEQLGQFEVLILGDQFYVNTSYTGWMSGSIDDLAGGADSLKELREGHSPFDYRSLVDSLNAKVENLGDTTVFGKTYTRLRITTDLKTMMKDVAGSSFGDNGLDPTLLGVDFSSPVTMDILVDLRDEVQVLRLQRAGGHSRGAEGREAVRQGVRGVALRDWPALVPQPPHNRARFRSRPAPALEGA